MRHFIKSNTSDISVTFNILLKQRLHCAILIVPASAISFKRIDELNKVLYFKENIQIQIDDIVDIEILEQ